MMIRGSGLLFWATLNMMHKAHYIYFQ